MTIIIDSLSEFNKLPNSVIERAHLVLLRNHEMNDFSVLKKRDPLGPEDIQKCTIAIDLLNDVVCHKNIMTGNKIAKELLKI